LSLCPTARWIHEATDRSWGFGAPLDLVEHVGGEALGMGFSLSPTPPCKLCGVAGSGVASILCPAGGTVEADPEHLRDHGGGHLRRHLHECGVSPQGGRDAEGNIVPYFNGIAAGLRSRGGRYVQGVYGSRNVCTRVSGEGYARHSFVSGMSYGFSGNLGFAMPDNWAFTQIKEFDFEPSSSDPFPLDNNVWRKTDPGCGPENVTGRDSTLDEFLVPPRGGEGAGQAADRNGLTNRGGATGEPHRPDHALSEVAGGHQRLCSMCALPVRMGFSASARSGSSVPRPVSPRPVNSWSVA